MFDVVGILDEFSDRSRRAPHRTVFIHRPLVILRKCISRVDCNVDHAVVFGFVPASCDPSGPSVPAAIIYDAEKPV